MSIYGPVDRVSAIRQGEILSDVSLYVYDPASGDVDQSTMQYCLTGTQDCDLQRYWEKRQAGENFALGILLFEADDATSARKKIGASTDMWRRITANNEARYQFLESPNLTCELDGNIPDLVVDFRRCLTVPAQQLYGQTEPAPQSRRCRLLSPYKEHFQSRAAYYLFRVGLERDHGRTMVVAPPAVPAIEDGRG
jgi:hypothetical protein